MTYCPINNYKSSAVDILAQISRRRKELRMTYAALSKHSGIPASTLRKMLTKQSPRTSTAAIEAVLAALDGRLVATWHTTAHQARTEQAAKKARWLVRLVQGSSGLEGQAVDAATAEEMVEQTVNELMARSDKKLWD